MLTTFRNLFAPPRDLIIVVAAIWVGLYLAEKRVQKHNVSISDLNNIVFFPIIGYLLGGRILFAIENLSAFKQNPASIISLNLELFDPSGGFAIALMVAYVYGQRKKLSLWSTLDALTPLLAVFTLGLGLAHLASGSAFGSETTLPWGLELWGAMRHPSQIYEIIAALLIFSLVWFKLPDSPPGVSFLTFAAMTSGAHLFLEAFRGDSTLFIIGFRKAQIAAWFVLAASLFFIDKFSKKPSKEMD